MKLKDGFIVREVAGQILAVPVGKRTKDVHGVIAMNETAAFLWKQMSEGVEKKELIRRLLIEYDVNQLEAEASVEDFLKDLKKQMLIDG